MQISAIILTKNEESNISECIAGVAFTDEILVIDDFSEDRTAEIARRYGAKVIKHALEEDFAAQRQFAMRQASHPWVLFVDADERVSRVLREAIEKAVAEDGRKNGYYITRKSIFFGKKLKYGEWGSKKLIRLMRRDRAKWIRAVHEQAQIKGSVGELQGELVHYMDNNISSFLYKINRYTTIHAGANKDAGKRANLLKIIFYPPAHFLRNYFFRLGFLDGTPGLVLALFLSMHSFFAWSKLWLLENR